MKRECHGNQFTLASSSRRGFSLIELLVVIGIMSLLVTVAMVNMQGFNKSNSITMAGNQIVDMASQARQYAAARNSKTALVFIKSSNYESTDATMPRIALRTFCVMRLTNPPGSTTPQWTMLTKWENLPSSVTLDSASSFLRSQASFVDPITTVTNRGKPYSGTELGYQIFLPDGGMDPGDGTIRKLRVIAKDAVGSTPNNYYDIIFNNYTGGTKVERPEDQ